MGSVGKNISIRNVVQNYIHHFIAIILILIYYSPYLIMGEDAYVSRNPDNLDVIHIYKIITDNGYMFSSGNTIVPNGLTGIPRFCYRSEFYYLTWLFYFFKPFWAWTINSIFISIVAYIGAYLFLKKYLLNYLISKNLVSPFILNNQQYLNISISGVSLYFALIPYWIYGGLSIAGQPLVLYSLLNLKNKSSYKDWLVIILFPFFSDFVSSNIFFYLVLSVLFLFLMLRNKKIYYRIILAFFILLLLSVVVEYRLFYNELTHQVETHRMMFKSGEIRNQLSLFGHIKETLLMMYQNKFDFFSWFVIPNIFRTDAQVIALWIISLTIFFIFIKNYIKAKILFGIFLLSYLIITALTNPAIIKTPIVWIVPLLKNTIGGLSIRFYMVSQIIWLIIYFISVILFIDNKKKWVITVFFFMINITYQFAFIPQAKSTNNAFLNNYVKKYKPSYREFFDEQLFSNIDQYIQATYSLKKSEYRIGTVVTSLPTEKNGVLFDPVIPLYNNFMTIDGYYPVYPKSTDVTIRKMIKIKETEFRRIYITPDEFSANGEINSLPVNYAELKKHNCKFLFSVRKISDRVEDLKFVKEFQGLYWKVYLYEIK